MSVVSENIQSRMWALNITQDQLAKMVGYAGKTSINKIVNGEQTPPLDKIEAFARALKTTPAILCGWDTDEDSDDDGRHGYDLRILAKRLKKKKYDVDIFTTSEETNNYIIKRCQGKPVGVAESSTLSGMGLLDKLKEANGELVYSGDIRNNRANRKKAITSDVFILSANAISYETGDIVNISSDGLRVAGSLYYADEVIFVIGKNKITHNLQEALERVRNIAKPKVAKMRGYRTPCAVSGTCEQCNAPDSACKVTCIYHQGIKLVHTTIVLVDEVLGTS